MSCHLIDASYGKSKIRLTKVSRSPELHGLKELSVDVQLQGQFDDSYMTGDNKLIVATDTIKNTVYALAAGHPIDSIENFAKHLADHFLSKNQHVHVASVTVHEDLWQRIEHDGKPHRHAFIGGQTERRVTNVDAMRGCVSVESGIEDLVLLKTADSQFCGFLRDEYTTLADVPDRIFATTMTAQWTYKSASAAFDNVYGKLRRLFLDIFAEHRSLSVQQTLYAMCSAALEHCPDIEEIRISMPNQHRVPVDLSAFGVLSTNEIFVPVDEPFGLISATVSREIRPCMQPPAVAKSNA